MRSLSIGVIAAAMLMSPAAFAGDKDDNSEEGYAYEFEDDALSAGSRYSKGARIRIVPPAKRATLIRPRLHFVPELLKSVELL